LSAQRLQELKSEIELFEEKEELNGFQKWIVEGLYDFSTSAAGFAVKSVLLVAMPHAAFTRAGFVRQSKKYSFLCLAMSDFSPVEKYLGEYLSPRGYHMESTPKLPLKRLAARSGLAVYGRNNICYAEGMGSYFSLSAYFSDLPCGDADDWTAMRSSDACAGCEICYQSCPTGAIRKERFLIDNERCLSYFNESPGEFPEWLPPQVHHCLYDCLKCQIGCPMNRHAAGCSAELVEFSEEETDAILSGKPHESYAPDLRRKTETLGLDKWHDAIPRNLRILFELSDKGDLAAPCQDTLRTRRHSSR
jgi:epoxyqueuosine reductase